MAPAEEAEKVLRKAEASWSPSLLSFRLAPDWETACPLFERAALLFKQSNDLPRAISSLERASRCQEKMGSAWHAAKHLESCAAMSAQLMADTGVGAHLSSPSPSSSSAPPSAARDYAVRAAHLYAENGRASTGAEALARCARLLERPSPAEAALLYEEALDMAEAAADGGRDGAGAGMQAADSYRAAVALALARGLWSDAASLGLRFGEACDRAGARQSQARAYLGAFVALLYAGDAAGAWAAYCDVEPVGVFAASEEARAARALFDAYRGSGGAEEGVRAAVAGCAALRHLDAPSARLAVKLPAPGSDLRAMAAALEGVAGGGGGGGGAGDQDEDDIT